MTASARLPPAPVGSTGTSRARRYAPHGGAPRRARVPPIDYGSLLSRSGWVGVGAALANG